MATYEELIEEAKKIKENELPESNTHTLVGYQLVQMVKKSQEESEESDKRLKELESMNVFLSQDEYDRLQNIDHDKIYFIYEE